jgi:hypothetical protein
MILARLPPRTLMSEPRAARKSKTISTRSRPYMSPSRPHTAADAAATRRNAVTDHPTVVASLSNSVISVGTAANIIEVSKALMISTAMSTATITHIGRRRT